LRKRQCRWHLILGFALCHGDAITSVVSGSSWPDGEGDRRRLVRDDGRLLANALGDSAVAPVSPADDDAAPTCAPELCASWIS
jgi:hypothetical protein